MTRVHLDPDDWPAKAGGPAFMVRHDLVGDERLTHAAVSELAGRLDPADVEMNTKHLPQVMHTDAVPELDRDPHELASSIDVLERWMALSYIEQDPVYKALVDECLDDVQAASAGWTDEMTKREGYIFLSAPGSVTPAHVDHEHNFLLQIRGTKVMTIGFAEPAVENEALEGMYSGRYGRTSELPEGAERFVLEPGTGVYVPPRAVHMIENQDDISISLSLVFHTPILDRAAAVYAFNAKMRRAGFRPRPPGSRNVTDRVKSATVRGWRRTRSVASGRRNGGTTATERDHGSS